MALERREALKQTEDAVWASSVNTRQRWRCTLDLIGTHDRLFITFLVCCSVCLFSASAVAEESASYVTGVEPETQSTGSKGSQTRPNLVSLYLGGIGVVDLDGITITEDDVVYFFPSLTLGYERKLVRWFSVGAILSWNGYHPGWVDTMRVSGSVRVILPLFDNLLELFLGGRFGLALNIFKDTWTEGDPLTAKAGFSMSGLAGFRFYIRRVFIGAEACSGIDIVNRPEFGETDRLTTLIEANGGVGLQF